MATKKRVKLVPAVLSGGSGTRLWPLSRKASPKQFHALTGGRTMLAETLVRCAGLSGADVIDPLVICNGAHADLALQALDEAGFPKGVAILESTGRNTAPAAALACLHALSLDEDALVLLMPADHHIRDVAAFHEAVEKAIPLAQDEYLVTFGIEPDAPETGYGYIQSGEPIGKGMSIRRFVEKPDLSTAKSYLDQGGFYWNAGIFLLNAKAFMEELATFCPDISRPVTEAYKEAETKGRLLRPQEDAWIRTDSDSIDFAVAEKTERGAVVPVSMGWSDVGSWEAIHSLAAKNEEGNCFEGPVVETGSYGNYVRTNGKRIVALAGCEDLIVVDTPDAVFIAPRKNSQAVKQLVAELKNAGYSDLL